MKKINIALLSLLVVFVLASCSKEKRIEKSLYKKGGEWSVSSYKQESYTNGSLDYSDTYANAGTMDFSKSGTLVWTFTLDGYTDVYGGSWSNTEDKLTIIIDGEGIVFDIKERSRKSMMLENVQTDNYNGISNQYKLTLEIEKK